MMATYQEQLAKLAEKRAKADRAEQTFDRMCGSIADVLLPYIENKTLTHDQASDLMVKIVKAVLASAEKP